MSAFRGSFFRQAQTQSYLSTYKHNSSFYSRVDEHNPPGSFFREEQTISLYGQSAQREWRQVTPVTLATEVVDAVQDERFTGDKRKISEPIPHLRVLPSVIASADEEDTRQPPVLQLVPLATRSTEFDLEAFTNRRNALMAARRLIERATEITDDDCTYLDLKPYLDDVRSAAKAFERGIKPRGPLRSTIERLFED